MKLIDFFRALIGFQTSDSFMLSPIPNERINESKPETRAKTSTANTVPRFAGGRISMDDPNAVITHSAFNVTQDESSVYIRRSLSDTFNARDFQRLPVDKLTEIMCDVSPELSSALWFFLLMANKDVSISAFKSGTRDIDEKATEALKKIREKIAEYHGAETVFYDQLFISLFLRGAAFMELVLAENARDFVDIAIPDPATISFRKVEHEIRGMVWEIGQWQHGNFVSLETPNTLYLPVHPLPGKRKGRSLVTSSFFLCLFLMVILRDFKRVVQTQGYLRIDIEIDFEAIKAALPATLGQSPEELKKVTDMITSDVQDFYSRLKPDDAYVHSSAIKINNPVGSNTSQSLQGMDSLFKSLERMATRALKTMPLLMGLTESSNQADSNRQFEFYQQGIDTIQTLLEDGIERMYKNALQAQGIVCDVEVEFQKMRASEALRDEQVAFMKSKRAKFAYDSGWISQDEAAKLAMDIDTADVPVPRSNPDTNTAGIMQLQPDGSVNRAKNIFDLERTPTLSEVDSALSLWKELAPDDVKELLSATPTE